MKNLRLPSFHHQLKYDFIKEILTGKVFSLNTDTANLYEYEDTCRHIFFSKIDYVNAFPDIRAVWEPARLQHCTILLAYALEEKEISKIKQLKQFVKHAILQWINSNPFLLGPHYISSMECGLRIPVLFYYLRFIDTLLSSEYELIIKTIYLHAWWISKRLSLYSSLGNHTIAESVGLIFAGVIFKRTRKGKQWLETGFNLLSTETEHQILNDGGPIEQSFCYHRFILDLYWLTVGFLEKNNIFDCSRIKQRLILGENFLNFFIRENSNMPSIGDSDESHAVAPEVFPHRLGSDIIKKKKYYYKIFPDSGYTVIRCRTNALFTFDHGPLGMPPLYNHGHADALSVTLSIDGEQILVDPGTYKYNDELEFRKYFKGTRAHNTVTIDGKDQAIQETSFIWSKPYNTKLIRCCDEKEGLLCEAFHDGYARLKEQVWHKRAIFFFEGAHFIIKDFFTGKGVHDFELNYHLHPEAVVKRVDKWWQISKAGHKIFIKSIGEYHLAYIYGCNNPLLGWYSPTYGIKKKSGVLHCVRRGYPGEISFITAICIGLPANEDRFIELAMRK
ncbi:MAG: alginate lyase family protein [bacterium]